jgi:hypothetical protein
MAAGFFVPTFIHYVYVSKILASYCCVELYATWYSFFTVIALNHRRRIHYPLMLSNLKNQ